jgi:uncharacterized membrane protein SpoIIM required for sporulation/uncharacterized RDD family membrane protein YckC
MTDPPADFRQHLVVETPEHVTLDYEIAGIASRALAAFLDTLIVTLWVLGLVIAVDSLDLIPGPWRVALTIMASFVLAQGYFIFFEAFRQGQTPGKRRLGIRVVQDTGHPISPSAAVIRNLLRLADFLPPPYLLGALLVAFHPRGKRLGDLAAGTVVVRDQPGEVTERPPPAEAAPEMLGIPELSDEEFRVVREFGERWGSLEEPVRARLADRLTLRFAERYPNRPADPVEFLLGLYRDELARRRSRYGARLAVRGRPGTGRSVAELLAARKGPRWLEFQQLATRATREGLDSFRAAELPDYAARYREVAADLARARTYQAEPAILARLERLVVAGHNTLYRDQRRPLSHLWHLLAAECPAAVIQARLYVLLAFVAFAAPAVGGYLLLRERPSLAAAVLPDVILDRAEAGLARQRSGHGYFEAGAGLRPMVASSIITNNVQVAISCFAGGAFLGVGSLFFLAFNGLAFGAFSGHFANAGLLGYLWTFVVGHGVLELFAIWVAGAAGFMLGRALIAPGDLTRAEALVLQGRIAVRMIGVVVLLLLIAGSIEGFVSASTAPVELRIAVSAASLVFLVLYLANGARTRRAERRP